jgi:hypothetical protein
MLRPSTIFAGGQPSICAAAAVDEHAAAVHVDAEDALAGGFVSSSEHLPARPDAAERLEQCAEDARGLHMVMQRRGLRMVVVQPRRVRMVGERVEQVPRLADRGEGLRLRTQRFAEPPHQCCAAVQADQRVVGAHLEDLGQRRRIEPQQRRRIDTDRIARIRREAPGQEGTKARHAQAFAAAEGLAALGLAVAPVGAGAGVEQHADQRQVDGGPRHPPRSAASGCGTGSSGRGSASASASAMRCATASSFERSSVKCSEPPAATKAAMAAQRARIVAGSRSVRTAASAHSRLRPFTFASCASSGTAPSVK